MIGHIHSIESFGTVDGPGVRMVIFLKGCPLRCKYCHNPDTWDMAGGTDMTVDGLLEQFEASRPFYERGGITVSGGEPLLQAAFVTELFTEAKKRGIHTCLDTSGVTYRPGSEASLREIGRLLDVTDLVLLDIKHIDPDKHKELCGQPNEHILAFARYLDGRGIPMWIRHVVVPGLTYDPEALRRLGLFIGGLRCVKALDVLPYHDMGKVKYENLGLAYPLKDVKPLPKEDAVRAKKMILAGIREARRAEAGRATAE